MDFLSRISVRAKLGLLVATLAASILLVAGASLWSLERAVAVSERLVSVDMVAARALADARAGVGNIRRFEKDMFLNMVNEEALERYEKSWRKELADNRQRLTAARPSLSAEENAMVERMLSGFGEYTKNVETILTGIKTGKINDPWAANTALEPSKGVIRSTDKALADLNQSLDQRTQQRILELGTMQRQASIAIVVSALAMVLVAVALAWIVSGRITSPLSRAVMAVERVSKGDLTVDVRSSGRDELGRLLSDISTMQNSLATLVGELRTGIDSVAIASAEIARGNGDLSARTELQASSLQQTASSMEQLTGAVRSSLENARAAQQRAQQATAVAEHGGTVVGQVVSTMQEIQTSSRRIAEITGVIDGIAFQTNILALNAAVEAARAGEQGRGFAVVASEVRALAQRSAEAARQIKGLISDSVNRVEAGSNLVGEAGRTIERAVEEVREVNELISQITLAASEQGQGIEEVGRAIGTLDQMTQQNAALVEQTAAASESLREQSNRLASSVAVLRT